MLRVNDTPSAARRRPGPLAYAFRTLALFALLAAAAVAARAQQRATQYDQGTPPQHKAGVSPLSSYISADLGTVGLTNGSLNFSLPVGVVGGRGFWLPLSLNYSSKVWSSQTGSEFITDPQPTTKSAVWAVYDDSDAPRDRFQKLAPGWTVGAVPTLHARGVGINPFHSNVTGCDDYSSGLVKLTVILPDKGEIELRDDVRDGQPVGTLQGPNNCRFMDGYRGRRWHAADGSGAVFISDVDNGVVNGNLNGVFVTADGLRYRFDDDPVYSFNGSLNMKEFAHASSVTDRNGNRVLISYQESPRAVTYTDQLGRTTTVEYDVNDPSNGEALAARVTVPGYGGTPRVYKVRAGVMNQNYAAGVNPTLPVFNGDADGAEVGCSAQIAHTSLFPRSWCGGTDRIDTKRVLTQLVLPDGRAVTFKYNEFGEVAEVILPTGGRLTYEYQYVAGLPSGNSMTFEIHGQQGSDVREVDRAVTKRRVYPDGSVAEAVWTYSYTAQSSIASDGVLTSGGVTEVVARSSDDTSTSANVLARQKHLFLDAKRYLSALHGGTGYALWSTGLERRTESLSADGAAVLSAAEMDWSQRACVIWSGACATQQIANDNRVNETRKVLDDGKVARTTTTYDQYNNQREVAEYDYDGTLKRRTVTDYLTVDASSGIDYTGDSIHLLRLPTQQSVYSSTAASSEAAREVYEYDRYADDGNNYILTTYPVTPTPVTGHDTANYGAGRSARGNPTRAGRWLKASNTYTDAYTRYDMLGNIVSAKDQRGNVSSVSYLDDYGDGASPGGTAAGARGPTYAMPTLLTSPAPNAGEQPHTARCQYDYSTGLLTGFKDRNGAVTQTLYNDAFDRPTLVKAALGVQGVESHTAIFYAPATAYGVTLDKNDVLTVKDQNTTDDAALLTWTRTDGLGRTVKALTRDPQGDVALKTVYDGLGRVKFTTNPYRSQAAATDGWTRTTYDLLGRPQEVASFGGPSGATPPESGVNADWTGSIVTQYVGPEVTVTDQGGKKRKSVSDALGRLTSVYEDPQGANQLTSYGYDVLGNLTTVTQGVQSRSFGYDSLSRLTSATNPEVCQQGPTACAAAAVTFDYYPDGAVFHKTDARGVVTTYVYDALGRVKSRTYSDGTPAVAYAYDAQPLPQGAPTFDRGLSVGRLVAVTYGGATSAAGSYLGSYDAAGRPRLSRQLTDAGAAAGLTTFEVGYAYDLVGHMKAETYPSGRVVETRYDTAGRVAGVMNQTTGFYYAGGAAEQDSRIQYTAHGAAAKLRLGNGLWEHTAFNSRLQWEQSGLGSAAGIDPSKLRLTYGYGSAGGNNGNLRSQRIEGGGLDVTQTYDYDDLNRLWQAEEKAGTTSTWKQVFAYDAYGNRGFAAGTTSPDLQVNPATGQLVPDPARNPVFDAATNRIKVTEPGQGDYRYDAAGNLLCEPGRLCAQGQTYYAYDAENRLKTAGGAYEAGGTTYTYDGEGRRVRKAVAGGEVTAFVYDASGRVVAEYSNRVESRGTRYLTQDHLGSTRVVTDAQGNADSNNGASGSRHDFFPFGNEVPGDATWRTSGRGYTDDTLRQKFASKERDAETGLDYFGARYYASVKGRFSSVDPVMFAKQKLLDPQQWNAYAYTRDNPLRFTDPTGEYVCTDAKKCEKFEKARQEALKSDDADAVRAAEAYGDLSKKAGDKGDNGVTVVFKDELKGDRAGQVKRNQLGFEADPNNPGAVRASLTVTIKSSEAGNEEVLVHEGSHVADHQDFVKAFAASGGVITPQVQALNITGRDSERRAYRLSVTYAQRGNVTLNFGRCGMQEECKFPPTMMPALRDQQIDDLLTSQYDAKNLNSKLFPEKMFQ